MADNLLSWFLAGIELIFLAEAHMMLCFGLLTEVAVLTHRCSQWLQSSACAEPQSQGLSSFSCCPASEEAEGAQEDGRGHSRDS